MQARPHGGYSGSAANNERVSPNAASAFYRGNPFQRCPLWRISEIIWGVLGGCTDNVVVFFLSFFARNLLCLRVRWPRASITGHPGGTFVVESRRSCDCGSCRLQQYAFRSRSVPAVIWALVALRSYR